MSKMTKEALYTYMEKVALVWGGVISLLLGIASSVIPFVPGFIFIFIGLALISKGSRRFNNLKITRYTLKEFRKRLKNTKIPHINKLLMLL